MAKRISSRLKWTIVAGIVTVSVAIAAGVVVRKISPMLKGRVIGALKDRFGDAELQSLNVTLFPQVTITGTRLTLKREGRAGLPLISIESFTGSASIFRLFRKPYHIGLVRLEGLQIHVPPKGERTPQPEQSRHQKVSGFVIDEIVADGTLLTILPKEAWKEPLEFDLRRLRLRDAGPDNPMSFRATLTNATPPGDIETSGFFGPWQVDEPGQTPVSGSYEFRNADLSVFPGISGILSSDGSYRGVLGHIEADGQTDTPDFALKISGNPMHLTTNFHAIIDGTNGNTLLQPVKAQLGHSSIVASGGVEGTRGVKGKTVSLDVIVKQGQLEDMLRLAVKAKKPAMSGAISFHTKLVVPPGQVAIPEKLKLDGAFEVGAARFSELDVQEKVNALSHRGSGHPKEPNDEGTVASNFRGRFKLQNGVMTFQNLSFEVPGVEVTLAGTYGLLDEQIEFQGHARLEAKLSHTITGFKSFLLKAIDPFFAKNGAGAELPIAIKGTRDSPRFGLRLHAGRS